MLKIEHIFSSHVKYTTNDTTSKQYQEKDKHQIRKEMKMKTKRTAAEIQTPRMSFSLSLGH